MHELEGNTSIPEFNKIVGDIAGSVYNVVMNSPAADQNHFVLLPAITFKVKNCLGRFPNNAELDDVRLTEIAKDIRAGIVRLMWAFEFPFDVSYELAPKIEQSAYFTLKKAILNQALVRVEGEI